MRLKPDFQLLVLQSRHKSGAMQTASETEVGVGVSIMGLGTLCLTLGEFLMKKTLIALAAVAAASASYAQVAITGGMDFTIGQTVQSTTDGSASKGINNTDAYISVSVKEDMGGGLTAASYMDFNVDGSFQGNAYGGDKTFSIASSTMSLTLANTRTGGTLGAVFMAPVVSSTDHWGTANALVMSRSAIDALIVKATVAPGASLAYKYLEAGVTGSGTPTATINVITAAYAAGALSLTGDYAMYSGASYTGDVRTSKLTANAIYNAGFATVGLGYDGGAAGTANSTSTGAAAGGVFFGASAPLGAATVGLNYGKRDAASVVEVGAKYMLSKQTFVTGSYAYFDNVGSKQDSYGLRLGHSF